LASIYSTDDSGPFVNGVLAAIAAEVRGDGGTKPAELSPS
jgi:transcription termination factor NusB